MAIIPKQIVKRPSIPEGMTLQTACDPKKVAEIVNIPIKELKALRENGKGPAHFQKHGQVKYYLGRVLYWWHKTYDEDNFTGPKETCPHWHYEVLSPIATLYEKKKIADQMRLWLVNVVDRRDIDAALQKPVGTDLLLHTADKLDRWANEKMTRRLIYYYGYTIHPCQYRLWNISRLMQKLILRLKCNVPEVVADIEKHYEKLKADVKQKDQELQFQQFKPGHSIFPNTQFFVDERHLALSLQSLKYQAGIFADVLRDVAEIATSKVETKNVKETTTAQTSPEIELMDQISKKLKTLADQNKRLIRKFSASLTGPLPPMDYERVVVYLQGNNPNMAGLVKEHYEELISCAKKIDTLTADSSRSALETATSLVGKLRFLANRLAQTLEVAVQDLTTEKPAETEPDTTPTKRWGIWALVERIPRWIYVLVIFLAALLTCVYLLSWLWTKFSE